MSLIQASPHLRKGRLRIENSAAQMEVPELHLSGAATFLQLPHLNAALEQQASRRGAIRLAVDRLHHIDHTCLEMIQDWSVRQATAGTHIEVVGGSNRMRQRLAHAVSPVPSH